MAALDSLRGALAGVSPRERRLLSILGGVFLLLALVGVYFWSASALDDIESERAAAIEALRTIRIERPHIRERQAVRDAVLAKYRTRAPALTSVVETAAHDSNVTVAEATDRPVGPADARGFQRRSVSIRLRRVDLQSLVAFMNAIDNEPYPVAITGYRVRKKFGESNVYDVDDLVISTWDRVDGASATTGSGTTGAAGAATTGARSGSRTSGSDELR